MKNKAIEKTNALLKFLKETDSKTKDIALQFQYGDKISDLVIKVDGDNLHLVSRKNAKEESHVQLNPAGIFLRSKDEVTMLGFGTATKFLRDIFKETDKLLGQAIQFIPAEALPTGKEIQNTINELSILAAEEAAQEQIDAAALSSAALGVINKFKPENILDVKEEDGSLEISLRNKAYASAIAEAVDELMLNPDLAEIVDRQAQLEGGMTFAELQEEWLRNREATMKAIRSIESKEQIDKDGHWASSFEIGKGIWNNILVGDWDIWIDPKKGEEADISVSLGFKDKDPLLVYELAVDPSFRWEKLTSGDSMVELQLAYENKHINRGKAIAKVKGNEELRTEFGPDYFYMKGPRGGISTSVRETWTGKTRYELYAENAKGKEASVTVDFYEDDNSLVSELNSSKSGKPAIFKLSRVDKLNIEDLSASEKINKLTVDNLVKEELKYLLKGVIKTAK